MLEYLTRTEKYQLFTGNYSWQLFFNCRILHITSFNFHVLNGFMKYLDPIY